MIAQLASSFGSASSTLGQSRSPCLPVTVRAVSEMTELQAAVLELQTQLSALQLNTDPSKANMLKVGGIVCWVIMH